MATRRVQPQAQKPPPGDVATEKVSADDAEQPIDPAFREWLGRLWPPIDLGPWPEGFAVSREEIYGEDGR